MIELFLNHLFPIPAWLSVSQLRGDPVYQVAKDLGCSCTGANEQGGVIRFE